MTTEVCRRRERRRGQSAGGNVLNEQRKWRIFVTAFTSFSRKRLRKWLKPHLQRSQVGIHLRMIHARTNLRILNCEVLSMRSSADCVRRVRRWNPRRRIIDLANKVCGHLTKDGDAGIYTPLKLRRSPRRMSPSSVSSMASSHPGHASMVESSGRKSASKALSGSLIFW